MFLASDEAALNERRKNMAEIKARLAQKLGLLLLIGAIPGWWATLGNLDVTWPQFAALFSLSVVGLLVLLFEERHPRVAHTLLLAVCCASFALALWRIPHPVVPYFSLVAVTMCGAVSLLMGLLAASAYTILVMLNSPPDAVYIVILLWLAWVIEWLASHGLQVALDWAWSAQQRSNRLLDELRQRRGELNRTLVALTEATRRLDRTNRELVIARQQADEARALREQFVANVSHELRTPLNLIVGFAEMMYLAPDTYEGVIWTPDLVSDVGRMYRASRHLQDLVNDILDLSRIDAARLPMFRELSDVCDTIESAIATVQPLLEQKGLFCKLVCADDLPKLFIDRVRIRQVMLNLLNNAIRFTDSGGITVTVKPIAESVVIAVQDTGLGIPSDQLEHIFKEFHQVEVGSRGRDGAGLGLAISRQFVELHGGRMWVESEMGVGSTFYLSLPLPGSVTPSTLERIPTRSRVDRSKMPVIVVDPDPSIAEMLSRYLGDRPVLAARDKLEADAMIEREHPLALLINQTPEMPLECWLGSSGPASARYNVPVLRCSIPSPSWLQQSSGLDGCLTKPVSRDTIKQIVAQYCRASDQILIVDDDPGFVSLLSRMLQTLGRDSTLAAYSGEEALRIIREKRPRLVLLDLLMPGMGGLEVAQEVRSDRSLDGVAVVAVTATSYAEEVLARHGGYITITQEGGYSTGAVAEFLNHALDIFQPNYVDAARTI